MLGGERRNKTRPIDWAALIGGLSLIFGIVAAGLSLAGWSFARSYLSHFQLGFQSVDLTYEILLLYGFWVAKEHGVWLLVIVSVVVGIGIWRPWRYIDVTLPILLLPGLVALIPTFMLVDSMAGKFASRTFETEKQNAFPYNRRVKVLVRVEKASDGFPDDLDQGCYRLLIKDNTNLVVFRPVKGLETVPPTVFMMPWENVAGFWVLDDSTSCS